MTRTVIALSLVTAANAFGQAVIERAILTGAGVTGTAGPARATGEGVRTVFGGVKTTLERSTESDKQERTRKPEGAAVVLPRSGAGSRDAAPASKAEPVPDLRSNVKPEDVSIGMSGGELLQLAGKPSLRITQEGREMLTFVLKSGASLDVTVVDGKVTEVKPVQAP